MYGNSNAGDQRCVFLIVLGNVWRVYEGGPAVDFGGMSTTHTRTATAFENMMGMFDFCMAVLSIKIVL